MPIVVKGLQVRRGGFVLDVPTLEVEPGTVLGVVGRNGAGKSTLLLTLAGLLRPDGGSVRVFGLDPWADPVAVRRRAAWMSDDMPVWVMRVDHLLDVLAGFYPTWDRALAAELARRLEVDGRRSTAELSKGEHTRLRLVLTFAFRPELVLLDEPATGLDVPSRRALLDLVLSEGTRTVLLSSHQMGDVERICDRVLLLEGGRVTADGTPADVAGAAGSLEERLAGVLR